MYRNLKLCNDLEFEILSETDSEIRGRMNIAYASRFGENGENDGVTRQEYIRVLGIASPSVGTAGLREAGLGICVVPARPLREILIRR